MRIGHGYDVHAFASHTNDVAGDRGAADPAHELAGNAASSIVLGGVRIAHPRPLLAHSDGDVVLHALCDAMLGAIAAGDIGVHFPDTDAAHAGADSRDLLRHCVALLREAGQGLHNADITIIAQAPKMAPHTDSMRRNIAADTGVELAQISVKATTTEQLGYIGRGEGIAVHAVVLLESL
jgi:2-C-methyl-D-erythritol 2,4-cyclodiphosphate synthase